MIRVEEFVERLCLLAADRGPRAFPRRREDRQILMKSIVLLLDSRRAYTEPEINEALKDWSRDVAPAIGVDHVTLRRLLVDHGQLERSADGGIYRVGFPASPVAFDLDVDEIDVRATIAAYLDHLRSRPRRAPGERTRSRASKKG
jgi:hypothetical protein